MIKIILGLLMFAVGFASVISLVIFQYINEFSNYIQAGIILLIIIVYVGSAVIGFNFVYKGLIGE